MIQVTRFNGTTFLINPDLIQFVEETPDTVITFLDGKKIVVNETSHDIMKLVIKYKREIFAPIIKMASADQIKKS